MGAPTSRRLRLLGRWLIMAVGFFFAMNLWSSETGVSGLPMADGLADQPLVAYEVANGQSAGCGVCDMQRDAASDPGVTCGERLDMAARQPVAAAPDPAAGACGERLERDQVLAVLQPAAAAPDPAAGACGKRLWRHLYSGIRTRGWK